MLSIILILSAIGVISGILIFIAYRVLPKEPQSLKKSEEIAENLPGMNCGACSFPGCFAYAQALEKDKDTFFSSTCAVVLQEPELLKGLEEQLGIEIDPSAINNKAVVMCYGNSDNIGEYSGIDSCKSASKLLGGFKRCLYGCLGCGDCMNVCPSDAIHIDEKMKVVVIDPKKCIGCGLCIEECPRDIIKLVPSDANIVYLCNYRSLKNIPGREKCDQGCIRCRKCFKACENDAIIWNEEKGIPEFDFTKCILCGKCIEVCPHDRLIELSNIALKEKAGILRQKKIKKRFTEKPGHCHDVRIL